MPSVVESDCQPCPMTKWPPRRDPTVLPVISGSSTLLPILNAAGPVLKVPVEDHGPKCPLEVARARQVNVVSAGKLVFTVTDDVLPPALANFGLAMTVEPFFTSISYVTEIKVYVPETFVMVSVT